MSGIRYLGDVLFDELGKVPSFIETARKLVSVDWRTGTESFQDYVKPLLDDIFAGKPFQGHGGLSYAYLERRVMSGILDGHQDPWLRVYAMLTGALIDPAIARAALNDIEGRQGKEVGRNE